jgi:hypothetical protein
MWREWEVWLREGRPEKTKTLFKSREKEDAAVVLSGEAASGRD